jgi:hypothetical protein
VILWSSIALADTRLYRVDGDGGRFTYFPSGFGPGVPGCMPNNYQCDFRVAGILGIDVAMDEMSAQITQPRLNLVGNEQLAAETRDSISQSVADFLSQTELILRERTPTEHIFEHTFTLNKTLTVAVNDARVEIDGGYDNRPVDGDGMLFDLTGTRLGDFDGDGQLSFSDIDLLAEMIRQGATESRFDLNLDGAVNEADHRTWAFDLKRSGYGDANLDGFFNSSDLVRVFQIGEYEDTIQLNSGWGDGDWNGDGEFTSSDFVRALQNNNRLCYETDCIGPRPAMSIPEPTACSLIFALVCVVYRSGMRRHSFDG